MKSLITISILLLSLSVLGQQQYIGLKGGRGWTNYYADGATGKYDYRTGLNMGLTYEYEFENNQLFFSHDSNEIRLFISEGLPLVFCIPEIGCK